MSQSRGEGADRFGHAGLSGLGMHDFSGMAAGDAESCARSRTDYCADYGASDAAIYPRLIGCRAAHLERCELLTDHIIVTKPFERHTRAGQHHNAGAAGYAGATG